MRGMLKASQNLTNLAPFTEETMSRQPEGWGGVGGGEGGRGRGRGSVEWGRRKSQISWLSGPMDTYFEGEALTLTHTHLLLSWVGWQQFQLCVPSCVQTPL